MRFLIFLVYIAIEIYLVAEVIDEWGFLAFIIEIAVSAFVGFGILASQFSVMSESLRNIMAFNISISNFLGRSILRALGGILLILPFVLSDIFGLTFFVMSLFFKVTERESADDFSNDFSHNFEREFDFSRDFRDSRTSRTSNDSSEIIDAEIIERVEDRK